MARNLSSVRNVGLRESVDQIIRQSQRDAARAAGDTDIEPRQFLTQQEQLKLQREGLKQWNDYLRAVATYRDSQTKSLKEELALKTQALKTLEGIGRAGQQAGASQNRVNIAGNLSLASENNELAIKALEEMAADLPAKDEATVLNLANDIETGNWGTSIQDIVNENPALFIEHYPAVMARLGDVLGTTPASLERVLIDESTSTNQPQITRIFTEGQRRHAGALDRIEELLDTAERAEDAADRLITSTPESREAFALAKQILDADPNNPDATLQSLGAGPGTAMDDLPGSEMYEQFLKTVGDVETEVYARQLFEATINDPLFNEYVRSQGYDPDQLSFGQKEQLLTPLITQRRREQGRDFVAGQAYVAAQTLAALDPRDDVAPTFTEVLDALIMGSTRPFKVIRELRRLGKQKRVRQVQQELQRQADQGIVPTEVEQDLPRVSAEEQQRATENLRRATEAAEAGEAPAAAEAEAAPEAPAEAPTEAAPETRMPSQAVIDSLQSNADRFGARPTIQLDSGEEVFVIPDGGGKLYQMVDGQLQEYAPAGAPEPAAPEAAPQPATSLEQAGATNIVSPAGDPYGPYGQFEDGSVGFMRDGKLVRVRPGQRGYDSIRSVLSGGEALIEGDAGDGTGDDAPPSDGKQGSLFNNIAAGITGSTDSQAAEMMDNEELLQKAEEDSPLGEAARREADRRDNNAIQLFKDGLVSYEDAVSRMIRPRDFREEAPPEPLAVTQGEGRDPFQSFLPSSPARGEEASAPAPASGGPVRVEPLEFSASEIVEDRGAFDDPVGDAERARQIMEEVRKRRLRMQNPNMVNIDEDPAVYAGRTGRTISPTRVAPLEIEGTPPPLEELDFSTMSRDEAMAEAREYQRVLEGQGLSPDQVYEEMERRIYSKNPEVFAPVMAEPMGTQEDIDRLRAAGGRPAGSPTRVAPLEISRKEIERDREAFDDPRGDAETASRIMRENRQRRLRTYNPTAQNPEQEAAAEEGVTIPSTRVAPLEIQGDSPPVRVAPLEIKGEARETLEPAETYSPSAEREEAQEAAASDEEDAAVEATETPAPEPAQTEFQNEPEEAKKEEEEEEEEEKEQAAAPRRGRQGLPDSGGRPSGGMAPPSGRSGGSQPRSPAKATLFEEQKMGVAANPGAQITGPPNLSSAESLVGTKKPITNQRNTLALRLAESAQKKAGQMGGMA